MRINPHFSVHQLRKQIERIQEASVKSVEAAMSFNSIFPADRIREAKTIQNNPNPSWDDFEKLKTALEVEFSGITGNPVTVSAIVYAMAKVAEKIDPSRVPFGQYDIFGSKLILVAKGGYTAGLFFRALNDNDRNNAAYTLCKFIERAGHRITNQNSLIELLLSINHSKVRSQVASLLSRTINLTWRKNPHGIGLIKAIREEHDNDNRGRLVLGLTNNRPDCLLKEYNLPGYGKCVLIMNIQGDPVSSTEINASYWVYHALKAELKEGEYYSKFSEKPSFSESELTNAVKYTTKTIDRYKSKDNLSSHDVIILHNSLVILTQVLKIATLDQIDSNSQGPLSHELRALSQKDLIGIARTFFNRETEIATVETIFPILLKYRLCAEMYPLEYLNNLKFDLSEKCNDLNSSDKERLNLAINSGLIAYLRENPQRQTRFSSVDNFNKSISVLLHGITPHELAIDITLQPKPRFLHSDTERLTLLRELCDINATGVIVSTGARSPLSIVHALDFSSTVSKENRNLLIPSLMANAHSGDKLPELINPTLNTANGASLLLLRSLTCSFKDYYGGKAIKELGIQFAQTVVRRQINRDKVGLLLSGPKGTGKSLFGQVLANEIGLPLITVTGAGIRDGQIYYPPKKQYYPIAIFFKELTAGGKAVLLIDEIESLASNSNPLLANQILNGLDFIQSTNSPIIVIGTTNCPGTKVAKKVEIERDGTSIELDRELESYVDARAVAKFRSCYLFHLPLIGSEFALDYIKNLTAEGHIVGEVPDSEIVRLCKRLSAAALESKINRLLIESSNRVQASSLLKELKTTKLYSAEVQSFAEKIKAKLTSSFAERGIHENERIDYPEVALMAQDLTILEISRKIDSITKTVNQQELIRILLS